jgi:hypothetical protein
MANGIVQGAHAPDSRRVSRTRVLLTGLIVYGGGTFTCDCKFRSLSATGARIAVAQHVQFPDRFYLINIRDGVAYDAVVVWNKGLELGIKIDSTISLTGKVGYAIERLRQLWLAKAPR